MAHDLKQTGKADDAETNSDRDREEAFWSGWLRSDFRKALQAPDCNVPHDLNR
jgi:hypothetical protein